MRIKNDHSASVFYPVIHWSECMNNGLKSNIGMSRNILLQEIFPCLAMKKGKNGVKKKKGKRKGKNKEGRRTRLVENCHKTS